MPTNIPGAEDGSLSRTVDTWGELIGSGMATPGPEMANELPEGTGDWADWYTEVYDYSKTFKLDEYAESLGSQTSVKLQQWATVKENVVVKGLHGCTAIIGVSKKGWFPLR